MASRNETFLPKKLSTDHKIKIGKEMLFFALTYKLKRITTYHKKIKDCKL